MTTSTWTSMLGASVKFDGRKYPGRYFEAGESNPDALLLLHGGGGYAENFTRNIMVYAKYFHVLVPDLAWFGMGPKPPFQEDIVEVWLDQLTDLLDWKGYRSAHVEGQSMGGWAAMCLARERPEWVRKLVLTTATGISVKTPQPVGAAAAAPVAAPAAAAPAAPRANPDDALLNPTYDNVYNRMKGLVADPTRIGEELIRIRMKLYGMPELQESMQKAGAAYRGARYGNDTPASKHCLSEKELAEIKQPTLVYWGE
ncbi:MAG TPA: alpha/beta hydrolase, partial [Dehalococcoidia bacterium]|nr:alpha/beta hydrolase [Dehalococcoidia bacterium]